MWAIAPTQISIHPPERWVKFLTSERQDQMKFIKDDNLFTDDERAAMDAALEAAEAEDEEGRICPDCGQPMPDGACWYCENEPIPAPSQCGHRRSLFVVAWQCLSTDQAKTTTPERYEVRLCPDCGQFDVFGRIRGQAFEVDFTLPTTELVKAAAVYQRRIAQPDAPQPPAAGQGGGE